ncbi:MAG TPA: hypothetical protein VIC33_02120 [Vicinamibacterales bacterium]|jgi:hypothetical protein
MRVADRPATNATSTSRTGRLTWTVTILVAFVGLTILGASRSGPTPAPALASTVAPVRSQPCTVEAPADARATARSWCQGGLFAHIDVSHEAGKFVVHLQLSDKGNALWNRDKSQVLTQFQHITEQLPQGARMNVALSFHDRNDDLVGGCFRRRGDGASICM